MELKLFEKFLNTQSIWAILFCFMFLYFLRVSSKREEERTKELQDFKAHIENDIKLIHANTSFIVTTWKVILEKEIKRRKKE